MFQDFTAKLSDFGLAKAGPQGDETHVSTRVMGTYGYAAPEYVMTGMFFDFNSCLHGLTPVNLCCKLIPFFMYFEDSLLFVYTQVI